MLISLNNSTSLNLARYSIVFFLQFALRKQTRLWPRNLRKIQNGTPHEPKGQLAPYKRSETSKHQEDGPQRRPSRKAKYAGLKPVLFSYILLKILDFSVWFWHHRSHFDNDKVVGFGIDAGWSIGLGRRHKHYRCSDDQETIRRVGEHVFRGKHLYWIALMN